MEYLSQCNMESKIPSIVISSILAFALIAEGIPTAFENVFAQGEGGTTCGSGGNITDGGGTGITSGTTGRTGDHNNR